MILITAVVIDILPRRLRRGVYFGVTTGPDFAGTPVAREVERKYRLIVWSGSVLALLLAEFGLFVTSMPLVNIGVFLQIGSMYGGWLASRKRVKPYAVAPDPTRVAPLAPEPRTPVGVLVSGLFVFLLMFGVMVTLWMQYDVFPDRFATHYGPSGQADAFRPKTASRVFGSAVTGLIAMLLVYANVYGIAFGCRRGGSPDAQNMRAAQQRFMLRMMGSIGFLVGIMIAFISASPLFSGQKLPGGPGSSAD